VFEETAGQDPKTRRYLALVLGLLGDERAATALRGGLADADADTVKNCLWALARLNDNAAAATAIELTRHDDASVRMMAAYALGALGDPRAAHVLAAALNDANELVKWNAAFALARKGDAAGRGVLVRLLDKQYVDRFTETTVENRRRYRVAAVMWLAKLGGADTVALLEKVSSEDEDLQVRSAAIQQLNQLRQD